MVELTRIPRNIIRYHIPHSILSDTLSHLRKIGYDYKEGVAYWSGILNKYEAIVTRVIFADNYPEFQNEEYFARVSLDTAFKIGNEMHDKNEILLAQIHTHPREAFHSFIDDTHPISHRIGFVSIVIPDFAQNVNLLSECMILEYLGMAMWNELFPREVADKFIVEKTSR